MIILFLIPIIFTLFVWFSVLAFVPVPWPDDSAFYFVAKDLFTWPPQWVMLSQAPFEPTYKIFNFNTMPLYPILLGVGRFIGIDGSFAIKFWPLLFWTLSGVLIGFVFYKKKLPFVLCVLIVLLFALDPIHRWASVLVRPESFVGLCGLAMVLGLSFGFPEKLKAKGIWDPVSCLLALAAYAHFNAIHLLFPAAFGLANQSLKSISKTAGKTALYLTPWLITVVIHYDLFIIQMHTQWTRLAIQNDWVSNLEKALSSLFQNMGAPTTWHSSLQIVSWIIWVFIGLSLILGIIIPAFITKKQDPKLPVLPPASGWILGAIWLWSSKPEVWFIYFLHISVWTFAGILIFRLWIQQKKLIYKISLMSILCLLLPNHFIFVYATYDQYREMHKSRSWNWTTYYDLIDCVERRLNKLEVTLNYPKPFRVWDPTFPDITIELSRRHPDWRFTRTNDFHTRANLAIEHGKNIEAVVVPEIFSQEEKWIEGTPAQYPRLYSAWMTWADMFLIHLWRDKKWKNNRYICQRGQWQVFMFMK